MNKKKSISAKNLHPEDDFPLGFLPKNRFYPLLILILLFVLSCSGIPLLSSLPSPTSESESPSISEFATEALPSPTELIPDATKFIETTEHEHAQYLPLLSAGGETKEPKGLVLSPTPRPIQPTVLPSPTLTTIPTAYATITPIPLSYLCIPPQSPQLGLVTKVVDGDTIRALIDGKEHKIRYIGIDAPESTTTQEPFGKEATKHNAELVRDQIVELYRDVSETDRFGRLLRYVVTNSVFVNLKLVEDGYAKAVTYPPDVACAVIFQQAERTARELGKGLWGSTTPSASPNCHPAYPDVCIPSPPPILSCSDISFRNFRVLPPDPHQFDQDGDGIGCEG